MDISHLLLIIVIVGVILLNLKIITELFNKKKANEKKRAKINSDVQMAFKEYKKNLRELQDKYQKLNTSFISYKNKVEQTISEMQEYTDNIIKMSNEIITFDNDFEEKLYVWCDLLNNTNNCEVVKAQIKEHLERDIKLKENIKQEQERQRIQRQQSIKKSLGLDLEL